MDNWTSCEDMMPPEDALYLVHCPSADPDSPWIATAWYDPNGHGWSFVPTGFRVTHWMRLPAPP